MNDNEKNLNPATSRDASVRRVDAPVPTPTSGAETDRRPPAVQGHAQHRSRNSRKRKKPFVL